MALESQDRGMGEVRKGRNGCHRSWNSTVEERRWRRYSNLRASVEGVERDQISTTCELTLGCVMEMGMGMGISMVIVRIVRPIFPVEEDWVVFSIKPTLGGLNPADGNAFKFPHSATQSCRDFGIIDA
jgi:hypothetical protein